MSSFKPAQWREDDIFNLSLSANQRPVSLMHQHGVVFDSDMQRCNEIFKAITVQIALLPDKKEHGNPMSSQKWMSKPSQIQLSNQFLSNHKIQQDGVEKERFDAEFVFVSFAFLKCGQWDVVLWKIQCYKKIWNKAKNNGWDKFMSFVYLILNFETL